MNIVPSNIPKITPTTGNITEVRKKWTPNEEIILYNEVDGFCPLCGESLTYTKNGKIYKNINIAHIYPYSPKPRELVTLKDVEKLSNNSNDIENVICLCPKCHLKFDKPRTLNEYNDLLKLKKNLLRKRSIYEKFYNYEIEYEIKQVINTLVEDNFDDKNISLQYSPVNIKNKFNSTMKPLVKRNITNNIGDYYYIIKQEFKNLDIINAHKAEQIAIQIKSFYFKTKQETDNQEEIYNYLVDWLYNKNKISKEASAIIISYFIQNCEVFDVIS